MKVFKYNGSGGIVSSGGAIIDESHLTRLNATVTDGVATIRRRIYFEAEHPYEDAMDIVTLPEFPVKYSAHPRHAAFKYFGNADINPLSEGSKIWAAELEYSTTDPNATDDDGHPVDDNTPPWKLRPENIQFTYPEVIKPLEAAYNDNGERYDSGGKVLVPVKNSAGDKIQLEYSVRNLQMSFTFNVENWSVNNALTYGNSINQNEITVCGLTIPAKRGLLLPPQCTYITVYNDKSTTVKWTYWAVNIDIQVDYTGDLLERKVLDVGNRATFPVLDLSYDDFLSAAKTLKSDLNLEIPATTVPSQICHFRLQKLMFANSDGTKVFWPVKENLSPDAGLVFCSWEQFLAARQLYIAASRILMENNVIKAEYDLQCEQDTQMPLDGLGGLDTSTIKGHVDYVENSPYVTKSFRQYPTTDWSSLHLPTKGIGQMVSSGGSISTP